MKGIILAAGRGSRMLDETADRPKCLVELAGRPLLAWQLKALAEAGVNDIAVIGGYRIEDLEPLSGRYGFTLLANPDWRETNMVSTLLCGREWSNQQACLVSYADIVYPADHVGSLLAATQPVAVTYDTEWESLWRLRAEDPLADAETFREIKGRLVEIGGKPDSLAEVQGQYMGLLQIREKGWPAIGEATGSLGEKTAKTDMTALLRLLLSRGVEIGAVPVSGRWCEVDNGEDRLRYENAIKAGNWRHDWRKAK